LRVNARTSIANFSAYMKRDVLTQKSGKWKG